MTPEEYGGTLKLFRTTVNELREIVTLVCLIVIQRAKSWGKGDLLLSSDRFRPER
jgi:hypothetical protein